MAAPVKCNAFFAGASLCSREMHNGSLTEGAGKLFFDSLENH